MKDNKQFKASSLKTLLIISIALTIVASIVGFYFAQNYLKQLANEKIPQATSYTPNNIDTTSIKSEIAKYQDVTNRANSFYVTSQNYQSQISNDIKSYGSVSGVQIDNLEFSPTDNKNLKSGASSIVSNLNSVTITVVNPVQFTKLIKFIKGIETNLPKMQISDISISRNSSNKNNVNVEPITVEYYVR